MGQCFYAVRVAGLGQRLAQRARLPGHSNGMSAMKCGNSLLV